MKRLPAAVLCASLAACAGPNAGSGGVLAGSEWSILAMDGTTPAQPGKARLSFAGDRIAAGVGCNRMSGPFRVENGRLIAGPFMQTRMYCEGPVWAQEQALSALLVGAPEVKMVGDRLSLTSAGHKAEFVRLSN